MIQRFQIEDLVIQDSSGVVFRALDTETDRTVAVRRFFPFGANGGGLRDDEQTAYNIAVERLATITHPALRAVICGGCDPVDGMPYIATEWIEGPRLEAIIARGPLDAEAAANLLSQALEVSELLSEVLAEEAVWVETSLRSIVVGAEGTGRGITFWIAPLKWLGKNDGQRGLESLITLTEELMGWAEKSVSDQAGRGLGGWLKWLRGQARTTTLHEARKMLAASIGLEPPVLAKKLVHHHAVAARPLVRARKKKASRLPIAIGALAALLTIASGGFLLAKRNGGANAARPVEPSLATVAENFSAPNSRTRKPHRELPAETQSIDDSASPELPATYRSGPRSVDQINREAAEFLASNRDRDREKDERRLAIQKQGNVFAVGDRELLLEMKNSEVQLEGRLAEVRFSDSGATLYLEFSNPAAKDEPRGYIMRKDLTEETGLESLRKLIGKNVRLTGKVNTSRRPDIEIKNLAAVHEVQ